MRYFSFCLFNVAQLLWFPQSILLLKSIYLYDNLKKKNKDKVKRPLKTGPTLKPVLTVAWVDPVCWDEVPFCEELCRPAAILACYNTRGEGKACMQQVNINCTVRLIVWWVFADLLYSSQALELSSAEVVLLLEGCGLQHEMLLLSGIHLLQVLCCCVRLSV